MKKVKFDIVDFQVNEMYSKELQDNESVDDRILAIEDFIKSCGWTVEEFEIYRDYGELN